VLSLSTLSTPTFFDDLKKCKEHYWKSEDDEESDEESDEDDEENEEGDD
jgi:hypothetical protein